jgi:YVTN family beta-propeller protein
MIVNGLALFATTSDIAQVFAQSNSAAHKNNNINSLARGSQPVFAVKTIKLPPSLAYGRDIIDVNPNTNLVYVLSYGSITIIDGNTNQIKGDLPLKPGDYTSLAVNPNTNMIYLIKANNNETTVINGTTNTVLKDILLPVTRPYADVFIAVNPNSNMIYVGQGNSTSVIDGRTNTVIKSIPTYSNRYQSIYSIGSIAVDPKLNLLYRALGDRVDVVDGKTNSITGKNIYTSADKLAVNPNNDNIYFTYGNTMYVLNNNTHLVTAIPHSFPIPSSPYHTEYFSDIAVNPNNNMVYTANYKENTTSVIDGRTDREVKTIPIGVYPTDLAINSKTNAVYVVHHRTYNNNTMSVITQLRR